MNPTRFWALQAGAELKNKIKGGQDFSYFTIWNKTINIVKGGAGKIISLQGSGPLPAPLSPPLPTRL